MGIPPGPGATWMQDHRAVWGKQQIKHLCIPKSHDAGMSKPPQMIRTALASENTVLTQTRNIYEQLELGVRRLDIRPVWINAEGKNSGWFCGHFSDIGVAGWQGGTGETLSQVVDAVSVFAQRHAELIILDITHIYYLEFDKWKGWVERTPEWPPMENLFNELKKLSHLFTMSNRDLSRPLSDYTLDEFIGNGQSAVVVLIEWDHIHKKDYGGLMSTLNFWPWGINAYDNEHSLRFPLENLEFKRMQTTTEAVAATAGDDSQSVLNLNRRFYEEHKTSILNETLHKGLQAMPGQVEMDVIESTVLLSWCLAITALKLHRLNPAQFPFPNNTALGYYGCKSVNIDDKVRSRTNINVGFETFGDNWPGVRKWYCGWVKQNDQIRDMYVEDTGWITL